MLKTTKSADISLFEKNNGKSIIVEFGDDDKQAIKKSGKSKGQKLSKSQKLAMFKKPSKVEIYLILVLKKPDQAF